MRKLVIVKAPADAELPGKDELDDIKRMLRKLEGRGRDLETIVLAPGWSVEVVEGDEVLVRLEALDSD